MACRPYFDSDMKIKGSERRRRFCLFMSVGVPTFTAAWQWAADSRRADDNPYIIRREASDGD